MQFPKSIFEIKLLARKVLRQQPNRILRLGWAPLLLVLLIVYLAMRLTTSFYAQFTGAVSYEQIYKAMNSWLTNNPQIYWYVIEGRLAYFLIFTGVAFACLDLLRQPKRQSTWGDGWQVFSQAYFFPVITLWLLILIISQLIGRLPSFVGLLLALIVRYGLMLTYFIYKDLSMQKPLSWRQWLLTLRLSWQLMRGQKLRLFWLEVSFWGWDLLNYFTWGILSLYLVPYKAASYAIFYQDLVNINGHKIIIK
ncbi:DUF975 family protein [Bombilactobacillus bombi]|uniref:DUF975 family protein n=1 Tax=Bombilactobacillus bombi TaxID=1303590 RepID=UPI0015E5B906|nr:DUF975 family protein [Bombilactobacillus bombi]MBA1434220.1 DUF975 family protein [Bombilactobacillus bombi]